MIIGIEISSKLIENLSFTFIFVTFCPFRLRWLHL